MPDPILDSVANEVFPEKKEECGLFGIFGDPDAVQKTYFGLHALQHRGQESAGIASSDGECLHVDAGLNTGVGFTPINICFPDVLDPEVIDRLGITRISP